MATLPTSASVVARHHKRRLPPTSFPCGAVVFIWSPFHPPLPRLPSEPTTSASSFGLSISFQSGSWVRWPSLSDERHRGGGHLIDSHDTKAASTRPSYRSYFPLFFASLHATVIEPPAPSVTAASRPATIGLVRVNRSQRHPHFSAA